MTYSMRSMGGGLSPGHYSRNPYGSDVMGTMGSEQQRLQYLYPGGGNQGMGWGPGGNAPGALTEAQSRAMAEGGGGGSWNPYGDFSGGGGGGGNVLANLLGFQQPMTMGSYTTTVQQPNLPNPYAAQQNLRANATANMYGGQFANDRNAIDAARANMYSAFTDQGRAMFPGNAQMQLAAQTAQADEGRALQDLALAMQGQNQQFQHGGASTLANLLMSMV